MFLTDIANTVNDLVATVIWIQILKWVLILGVAAIVLYFVIRATCKYQAKQNAEAFDYDYLAERTAAEICKRMLIIEKQRQSMNSDASGSTGNQNESDQNGNPVQDTKPLEHN